jgi:RNase adaptor protein for sRNA GlmZ degradation
MSKILIGIIVAMGLSGILYYQFSVVPMKNKLEEQTKVILAQDLRNQEQIATIEAIQNNLQQTTQALSGLQVQNQQYEAEMSEYLDIFRRHNLAKLASAKPGMIEKRANDRTKEVFDAIEADSKRISSLND